MFIQASPESTGKNSPCCSCLGKAHCNLLSAFTWSNFIEWTSAQTVSLDKFLLHKDQKRGTISLPTPDITAISFCVSFYIQRVDYIFPEFKDLFFLQLPVLQNHERTSICLKTFILFIFISCVWVCLHVCECTVCVCAQCPHQPEEAAGLPVTGAAYSSELPRGCWETKPGPLEEWPCS